MINVAVSELDDDMQDICEGEPQYIPDERNYIVSHIRSEQLGSRYLKSQEEFDEVNLNNDTSEEDP